MKSYKRNKKVFLRFLRVSLSAVLLLSTVTAFAGAKATLQGGSLYFENLIETKEETIVRTKVTGNRAEDITQKINVEYIGAGSEIVLAGDKDLDGTIVGVLSRNELNEKGTRITKSTVEATLAGDQVYVGTMELADISGITAEQSIGVSFDNKNLPGAVLGDEKALYELQLLFTPKNQKPFFYTYYLRLLSTDEGKTIDAATDTKDITTPKTDTSVTNEPSTAPPVDNTTTTPVTPVANTATTPVVPIDTKTQNTQNTLDTVNTSNSNTVPSTIAGTTATPSSTKISINGKESGCEVYNLNNFNYFKLRDFAMALNNTPKSFSVNWIEEQKTISMNSRAAYKPIGGELVLSKQYIAGEKPVAATMQSSMLFDNVGISLEGYIIKGNTYFKVRDLALLIDVSVYYDQTADTMVFNTDKLYQQ